MTKHSKTAKIKTTGWLINFCKNPRFYVGLLIIAIVGASAAYYKVLQNKKQAEFELGYAGGMIYRQVEGYQAACRENGYELKVYPQKFKAKYENEIKKIADTAKKYNYSLGELFAFIENNSNLKNKLIADIKSEMDNMRKQIILAALQEKENNRALVWNDAYDDILSLEGLCRDMDEHPEDYLKIYQETSYSTLKYIEDRF